MSDPLLNLALFIAAVFAVGQWLRSRDVLEHCEEFEKQLKESHVSDFDLYESEIEELYRKPEEPKVWLTIEEAILAKKCARYVAGYLAKDEEARMVWRFADKLSERIEQAEESNGQE